MPKTDQEKHETAFLLTEKRATRYAGETPLLRLTAHPVKILPPRAGAVTAGEILNFTAGSGTHIEPLADLVVTAQCEITTAEPYGWTTEYSNVFSVELERAEAMVKLLRKIEREHRKLNATVGWPESYGSYVARTAAILGASRFGWSTGPSNGQLYSDGTYHWTDVAGMLNHIAAIVRAFRTPAVLA